MFISMLSIAIIVIRISNDRLSMHIIINIYDNLFLRANTLYLLYFIYINEYYDLFHCISLVGHYLNWYK